MNFFSGWFLFGFVLGAIGGTLATDLTREDFRIESFGRPWRFWESRQQGLAFVFGLWLSLLLTTIILNTWTDILDAWVELVGGSIIGAAAAPWLWLHFIRNFGGNGKREAERKRAQIEKRAYEISQQEPNNTEEENWSKAEKQIEEVEESLTETSAKSADQQLARYQLLSIVLGTALLVAVLLPYLGEWLGRAQQFSAFGISLTLIATQSGIQNQPTLITSGPNVENAADRMRSATLDAYLIGAADPEHPTPLQSVGPALDNFQHLSVADRDRAYIAWLTFKEPDGARKLKLQDAANLSLVDYVEEAEHVLHHSKLDADPSFDRFFVAASSYISGCLHKKAEEIHDPHLLGEKVSAFLRNFVQDVYNARLTEYYSPGNSSKSTALSDPAICDFDDFGSIPEELLALYRANPREYPEPRGRLLYPPSPPPKDLQFMNSPYPSLVAANYLAAIGAVDTGALIIEKWIKAHKNDKDPKGPQREWYLLRAKLNAVNLLQYSPFPVPHRGLVSWQVDESNQLGGLIGVLDSDGWKRLCKELMASPVTLDENVGRWLANLYATERFYLFEHLAPEDFDPANNIPGRRSLTDYIGEAQAIRDDHSCLETVSYFRKYQTKYEGYFNLYTAQLRLLLLSGETNTERRKKLIEGIDRELAEAKNYLGDAAKPASSLLSVGDDEDKIWERHRLRLRLLTAQLENEKRRQL